MEFGGELKKRVFGVRKSAENCSKAANSTEEV
jgi:hypothetical protein